MTLYELERHAAADGDEWHVTALDDSGEVHLTMFHGPLAYERACFYQEHMNRANARPVIFPGD